MKLYLVHCGFYDSEVGDGIYEAHTNLFVAAETFEDARKKAKEDPIFKTKRMHVDGIQEIAAVRGYQIELREDASAETRLISHRHRDLAPKPSGTPN